MTNSLSEAMTTAEVAAALEVSVKTITRWVASERLKPVKRLPGKRGAYLFDPANVAAIIAGEPWEPAS